MGTEVSTIKLDASAFLDESYGRGGYRILKCGGSPSKIVDDEGLTVLEPFFDIIVGINDIELHDPKEKDSPMLFPLLAKLREDLFKDSETWWKQYTSTHNAIDVTATPPSMTIQLQILNIRQLSLRKVEMVMEPLVEFTDTGRNLYQVLKPSLGMTIDWEQISTTIRQFYSMARISTKTAPSCLQSDFQPDVDIMVGLGLVDTVHEGKLIYVALPREQERLLSIINTERNKSQGIGLIVFDAVREATRMVMIDDLTDGLGIEVTSGVQVWQRLAKDRSPNIDKPVPHESQKGYSANCSNRLTCSGAGSDGNSLVTIGAMLKMLKPGLPDLRFHKLVEEDVIMPMTNTEEVTSRQSSISSTSNPHPNSGPVMKPMFGSEPHTMISVESIEDDSGYGRVATDNHFDMLVDAVPVDASSIITDHRTGQQTSRHSNGKQIINENPKLLNLTMKISESFLCDSFDDVIQLSEILNKSSLRSLERTN